jgi:hypothetical protein
VRLGSVTYTLKAWTARGREAENATFRGPWCERQIAANLAAAAVTAKVLEGRVEANIERLRERSEAGIRHLETRILSGPTYSHFEQVPKGSY